MEFNHLILSLFHCLCPMVLIGGAQRKAIFPIWKLKLMWCVYICARCELQQECDEKPWASPPNCPWLPMGTRLPKVGTGSNSFRVRGPANALLVQANLHVENEHIDRKQEWKWPYLRRSPVLKQEGKRRQGKFLNTGSLN